MTTTSFYFLVCWSVIHIHCVTAAEELLEQTWIIELGLDKHGSWLKTHCDNIKSFTNTNQQKMHRQETVESDNLTLGDKFPAWPGDDLK